MPELLKEADVYTHLASDHNHYWEDGGATYHSRYSSYEFDLWAECVMPWYDEAALFGQHSGHVNCTDGRYVYMRGPACTDNTPLFNYTLMPTHMRGLFRVEELQDIELAEPFPFTRGCPTMKIASWNDQPVRPNVERFGTLLYDLQNDAPVAGRETIYE